MKYKTNELDDCDTLHRRCLLEQRFGVMAGEVLRRNIFAIFEVRASYEHLW
jgi:hypothetical protein